MCDHYDRYFPEEKESNERIFIANKKPPLGLMPKKYWDEQRVKDIEAAIIRYTLVKKEIPEEWIKELKSLQS